jgi:hypothetical protein
MENPKVSRSYRFDEVMTLLTGLNLCDRGIDAVHDIVEYITGVCPEQSYEENWAAQNLARHGIIQQHPVLHDYGYRQEGTLSFGEAAKRWVEAAEGRYGASYIRLERIPVPVYAKGASNAQ